MGWGTFVVHSHDRLEFICDFLRIKESLGFKRMWRSLFEKDKVAVGGDDDDNGATTTTMGNKFRLRIFVDS